MGKKLKASQQAYSEAKTVHSKELGAKVSLKKTVNDVKNIRVKLNELQGEAKDLKERLGQTKNSDQIKQFSERLGPINAKIEAVKMPLTSAEAKQKVEKSKAVVLSQEVATDKVELKKILEELQMTRGTKGEVTAEMRKAMDEGKSKIEEAMERAQQDQKALEAKAAEQATKIKKKFNEENDAKEQKKKAKVAADKAAELERKQPEKNRKAAKVAEAADKKARKESAALEKKNK